MTQTRSVFGVVELEPLQPAKVPTTPSSPQPVRDVVLGMALGYSWILACLDFRLASNRTRNPAGERGRQAYWDAQAEWDEKIKGTQVGRAPNLGLP